MQFIPPLAEDGGFLAYITLNHPDDSFDVSLDREENIVSLCSNCHNEIHYGRDAKILIEKLYSDRKELLESIGISITFDELLEMYGIQNR